MLGELSRVQQAFSIALDEFQTAVGIPEEVLEAVERARLPAREERYWRKDVLDVRSTGDLDLLAAEGFNALSSLVDPRWLREEGRKAHKLGDTFRTSPLHLVSGIRVGYDGPRPQRFAQMLLVCADHMARRSDLDFFEAPTLVSEVAALGTRLAAVRELGPEAAEKLGRLPAMPDAVVASTVYEFLVGTAGVLKGMELEMLAPDTYRKTPDFTIHNFSVPASIECKRRLGLSEYEIREAVHMGALYEAVRPVLAERHASVDVSFVVEVSAVDPGTFCSLVLPLLDGGTERREVRAPWGVVGTDTLPYTLDIPRTRLFAPDYLALVFGWRPDNGEWDGLTCEVDPPDSILVSRVRNPRCLKWVSRSADAVLKKSRGITSLWGRATQQIPTGDLGFVYIAYPEWNRSELADARTREIMEACQRWTHRWSVLIGATVINRLYPRAIGGGMPDFIESAIPLVSKGNEYLLGDVPSCVFVPPSSTA